MISSTSIFSYGLTKREHFVALLLSGMQYPFIQMSDDEIKGMIALADKTLKLCAETP